MRGDGDAYLAVGAGALVAVSLAGHFDDVKLRICAGELASC